VDALLSLALRGKAMLITMPPMVAKLHVMLSLTVLAQHVILLLPVVALLLLVTPTDLIPMKMQPTDVKLGVPLLQMERALHATLPFPVDALLLLAMPTK